MSTPPEKKKIESGADAIDNILGKKEETIKPNLPIPDKEVVDAIVAATIIEPENVSNIEQPIVEQEAKTTKKRKKEKKKKYIKLDEELLALRTDMISDVLSGMLCTKIKTGPGVELDRDTMAIKVRTFKRWLEIIQAYITKSEKNTKE